MTGWSFALSGFDYFSVGAGYNWGSGKLFGTHNAASVKGVVLEYKSLEELHLRGYGRLYGGSAAFLLGFSGVIATDFSQVTLGISPEVGLGIVSFNIIYRYNFYLDSDFNCHEIAISLYPY